MQTELDQKQKAMGLHLTTSKNPGPKKN